MNISKLIVIISICLAAAIYGQKDWERWSAADFSYELPETIEPSNYISRTNVSSFLLTSLKSTYSFFISDLDGDNCPFYPTCSAFFVQAAQETNLIKGSLMFADRFMRDYNIFKRKPYYPVYKTGRLYDPVANYKLRFDEIKYYPRDTIVN